MLDLLSKLNKKKTFNEMYEAIDEVQAGRYSQRELFWLKESVLNYIDLFDDENGTTMYTEQVLLDDVHGFIKRSKKISSTRTETTSGSMASSEAKNRLRNLCLKEQLERQDSGDHADLVFQTASAEVACVEIGLEDAGANGTKELQERQLKSPKMMKAFALKILEEYPQAKKEDIKMIAYIISGMHITAMCMTFKKGSMALISTSKRLKISETLKHVHALLPPVQLYRSD